MNKKKINSHQEFLELVSSDFNGEIVLSADESIRNNIIFNLGALDSGWETEFESCGSTCIEYCFKSDNLGMQVVIGDGPSPHYDLFAIERNN